MNEVVTTIGIVATILGLLSLAFFVLAQIGAAYFEQKWNEQIDEEKHED